MLARYLAILSLLVILPSSCYHAPPPRCIDKHTSEACSWPMNDVDSNYCTCTKDI